MKQSGNVIVIKHRDSGTFVLQNLGNSPIYLGTQNDINHLKSFGILINPNTTFRVFIKKNLKKSFYIYRELLQDIRYGLL